jgi:hypothetical protein
MLIFLQENHVGISIKSPKIYFNSAALRKGNTANWISPNERRCPETYPSNSYTLDWSIQYIFSDYYASQCCQFFLQHQQIHEKWSKWGMSQNKLFHLFVGIGATMANSHAHTSQKSNVISTTITFTLLLHQVLISEITQTRLL